MTYMNIIFPVTTLIFAFQLPAIIGLYWIYQNIFATIIQIILNKIYPIPVFTEADYAAAEEEMNRDYVPPKITNAIMMMVDIIKFTASLVTTEIGNISLGKYTFFIILPFSIIVEAERVIAVEKNVHGINPQHTKTV